MNINSFQTQVCDEENNKKIIKIKQRKVGFYFITK